MILLLHDACDILMELAKMLKYLNQARTRPPPLPPHTPSSLHLRLTLYGARPCCSHCATCPVQRSSIVRIRAALKSTMQGRNTMLVCVCIILTCLLPFVSQVACALTATARATCGALLPPAAQDFWGSVVFGLFMLTWILMRLLYFPVWVLWSTRWAAPCEPRSSEVLVGIEVYIVVQSSPKTAHKSRCACDPASAGLSLLACVRLCR